MFVVRTARSLCCSIFVESVSSRNAASVAGVRLHLPLCLLHGLHEREQRGECFGGAGRVGVVRSNLLDAQMKRAEIAQAGDEGRVFRHRQLQAKDAERSHDQRREDQCGREPQTLEKRGHVAVTRRQAATSRKTAKQLLDAGRGWSESARQTACSRRRWCHSRAARFAEGLCNAFSSPTRMVKIS